jgi:hypothetical protein
MTDTDDNSATSEAYGLSSSLLEDDRQDDRASEDDRASLHPVILHGAILSSCADEDDRPQSDRKTVVGKLYGDTSFGAHDAHFPASFAACAAASAAFAVFVLIRATSGWSSQLSLISFTVA